MNPTFNELEKSFDIVFNAGFILGFIVALSTIFILNYLILPFLNPYLEKKLNQLKDNGYE